MQVSDLRKIAEGREAEIFEWEGGYALRLMRDGHGSEAVERQAQALRVAHDVGVAVPAPIETAVVDGRHGLVMERVDGDDLFEVIGSKPWTVWSVGAVTGRLQAELHGVAAPATLPNLKEGLAGAIETSDLVPERVREFALGVLAELPDGDRLCHGDLHPGNMIETPDARHVIIDWSNACAGDPHADVARTELMIKLGDPPPGAPIVIRVMAGVARGLLGSAIRRGYRGVRDIDEDLLRRWTVPVAAHRLTDNIAPERSKLLKVLAQRLDEGQ